MLEQLK